jgi:hypothetical protein
VEEAFAAALELSEVEQEAYLTRETQNCAPRSDVCFALIDMKLSRNIPA